NPQCALAGAYGGDERAAVLGEFDPFLLSRATGGHLLGDALRVALTPDVIAIAGVGGEVHPLAIGGPCGVGTLRGLRAYRLPRVAGVERNHAAGQPFAEFHFYY